MEIRKLGIGNYEEITKLWTKAKLPYKPNGRDSKDAIAKEIEANPEFFIGAFESDQLIGTAIVSSDMRKGWINRLAVDPGYQRRSVAKALIAESERVLRKHCIRIFCALVENDNSASKALFKECNYVKHRDIIYFSKRESDEV